jgi:hypothetical protein
MIDKKAEKSAFLSRRKDIGFLNDLVNFWYIIFNISCTLFIDDSI